MKSGANKKLFKAVLGTAAIVGGLGLLNEPDEKSAVNRLAKSIQKTYQNIDVKVAQIPTSASGTGQQYDRNTGNAFGSTATYHSYTWDYCLKWVGTESCSKWLDPYVSVHGFGDDQSPLEGAVARKWQELKDVNKGQGGKYAIWDVATKAGESVTDDAGRLNKKALTKWALTDEVRQEVEQVGDDTALRAIASTYEGSEESAETMPNMENLRALAQSYTYMYRNNLVAKLGESRRMRDDIQMPGGEDYASCQAVIQEAKTVADQMNADQRLYAQAPLDIEAKTRSITERAALCEKMMATSVYTVNPQVRGDKVVKGNPNTEAIDEWRARMGIASVDFAGTDPGLLERPRDMDVSENENETGYYDYDDGGANRRLVKSTVAEQLTNYNRKLENAATEIKAMAQYNSFIPDASKQITSNKIETGSQSLMEINGLTKEMRNELKHSDSPEIAAPITAEPEQSAAELVITAAKQ